MFHAGGKMTRCAIREHVSAKRQADFIASDLAQSRLAVSPSADTINLNIPLH